MASFGTLYSYPNNVRLIKSYAAAAANDLELTEFPGFVMQTTNKTPSYLSKFPFGKVPALETSSGFTICESAAIAHYLADSGPARDQLLGATPEERGWIQQWLMHDMHEIMPNVAVGIRARHGYAPQDDEAEKSALEKLDVVLKIVERALEASEWIAGGEGCSLADIAIASTLYAGNKVWFGKSWREQYPVVMKHVEKVMALPKIGGAFPKIEWKE